MKRVKRTGLKTETNSEKWRVTYKSYIFNPLYTGNQAKFGTTKKSDILQMNQVFFWSGGTDMKKLYRSKRNKIIAGVCGGIGEYLGVDPTLVRLLWVLLSLQGIGIIGYVIAWIIIPEEP